MTTVRITDTSSNIHETAVDDTELDTGLIGWLVSRPRVQFGPDTMFVVVETIDAGRRLINIDRVVSVEVVD